MVDALTRSIGGIIIDAVGDVHTRLVGLFGGLITAPIVIVRFVVRTRANNDERNNQ